MALFGSAYIYSTTKEQALQQLASQGTGIASALNHAAMVAHSRSEMQHVVEEVIKDNPHIQLALIIGKDPDIILASSVPQWAGMAPMAIPDQEIVRALTLDTRTADHAHTGMWRDQPHLEIHRPLEAHLSSHTHEHSAAVTDIKPAPPSVVRSAQAHRDGQPDGHAKPVSIAADTAADTMNGDHHRHDEVAKSEENRGTILLLLNESGVEAVAISNTLRMAGNFSIAILLIMTLAYLLMSRQVLTPLDAINRAMRLREAGNKDVRAQVLGKDELAGVALTLNTMLETLGRNEQSLHQLTQAVEQSPTSVVITNPQGIIEYVNPCFCENTGYCRQELIGQSMATVKSGLTPQDTYQELWQTISAGGQWRGELHNRNKAGELYWENVIISPILNEQGVITQFLGIKEDITVRKGYEAKLIRQANFDDLTGLPNRILAQDRLDQAIVNAHRNGKNTQVALLFVDLDDFKKVNDTLGHDIGDQMLKDVAHRFKSHVRETDTIARFGGDEFLVIMADIYSQSDVEMMAEKLLEQLATPFSLGGMNFFINASIGIALYPDDGHDVQHLLQDADAAMNRAKLEGRARFSFFTAKMNDEAIENLKIEEGLRHALERKQLAVHFQPVIDCRNGDIVGAEALLRWNHPEWGSIAPFKFIPLAERTNLILPIGEWLLKESCRIAAKWVAAKQGNFRIAINLSAKQFGGRRILEEVKQALAESGLPAANLELEFTESVLMREDEETMGVIYELHGMGIRFAIDDFGTGYSSISYLRQYPFDTLKIDRSFINDVVTSHGDANLVRSIIALAESLELEVLAEGIEQWSQFDFLQQAGSSRCQGWLFSKAVPERVFFEQMQSWQTIQERRRAIA